MNRRYWLASIAALVVVTVTATAVPVLRDWRQQRSACEALRAELASHGGEVNRMGSGSTVAALGDSYLAGDVLDDRSDRWGAAFAAAEEVEVVAYAVGWTGFVAEGPCKDESFGARLSDVLATDPEALIVAGGTNDWREDSDDVERRAVDLLRRAEGVEQVLVVGPVDAPATSDEAAVDAALAAASQAAGRPYLSMLGLDPEFADDGVHLSPGGHAAYARRVAAAWPPHVARSGSP